MPDVIELTDDEAAAFCANAVVVGRTVVMAACTPRLERELRARGFEPVVVDVSEFLKAGGGPRCLTLALDVVGSGSQRRRRRRCADELHRPQLPPAAGDRDVRRRRRGCATSAAGATSTRSPPTRR